MKKSVRRILDYFPNLEKLISNPSSLNIEQSLNNLTGVEQTFLKLAWFFNNPNKEKFDLQNIYKNLSDNWVVVALEVIYLFFAEDTFLVQNETFSVVTEESEYLNQSEFARFLTDNGFEFSRHKINIYMKRGIVPVGDLNLSGVPYWKKETCEKYLKQLESTAETF